MTSRRGFLAIATAAPWVPSIAAATQSATARVPIGAAPASHVVVDPRRSESLAYARLQGGRASVHVMPSRLEPSWVSAMLDRARVDEAPLRGLTSAADFFVLRQLAADAGFRVRDQRARDSARLPLVEWALARG